MHLKGSISTILILWIFYQFKALNISTVLTILRPLFMGTIVIQKNFV